MLSFHDDKPLPNYDFQKKESVSVNPSFLPNHEPGSRIDSPLANGDAMDYFQLFYSDDFLESEINQRQCGIPTEH